MSTKNVRNVAFFLLALLLGASSAAACFASVVVAPGTEGQTSSGAAIAKSIGVIKTINGNAITLTPASGPEVSVTVQPTARILRLAPGDNDLKNATPLQLQELQVGDTIRARGPGSNDGKSINALEIIVITRSALTAVSDQIRQDWQKRGLGGLVSAVDAPTGTVTISVTGFSGKKTIAIHTSKSTVIRRYAPDSIKFEDAKPSSFAEIQSGDQLRARGDRSADGTEFTAEEIVTGRFRNIAGTVNSVDASAGTVTVQDVLSKKAVQVKITSDSQLHQIPAEAAQRIAARLKAAMAGSMPPGTPGAAANSTQGSGQGTPAGAPPNGAVSNAANSGATGPAGSAAGGARPGGGAPDFQSMLNRMPTVALTDLHKGDAVMLVTTEGSPSSASTAITLLSGVEPILQAAPNASQAMMLTPWSLGGAPGGDTASQ
jgi:hypothetical protein